MSVCVPLFPEIDAGNLLVTKPDRFVVLVTDGIRVTQSSEGNSCRPDQRKQEGPGSARSKVVADAFDAVQAKARTTNLRDCLNPGKAE